MNWLLLFNYFLYDFYPFMHMIKTGRINILLIRNSSQYYSHSCHSGRNLRDVLTPLFRGAGGVLTLFNE